MPRAKRRIPKRDGGIALSAPVEWELTRWRGLEIGGLCFTTAREFRDAWETHGELVTAAYVESMPGSRPFGAYVAGEIPMPPLIAKPYLSDTGRHIGGVVYHEARCYGIGDEPELEHLIGRGIVDAVEAQEARRRIDEHGPRCLHEFRSVSRRAAAETV